MQAALTSSDKEDWRTPPGFLVKVAKVGAIMLDPCASADPSHHFAHHNVDKVCDGLAADWAEHATGGIAYVNSEYGRALPAWVAKCAEEAERGTEIVQLTPARPGSGWWRAAKQAATAMCELDKRLQFVGAKDPAPFPSAVFYYGPQPFLFCHIFSEHGDVRCWA